jgi:predicted GNAT family acetyltransferase
MAFTVAGNRIEYEDNGKKLAEVCYPEQEKGVVDICRTFVDPSLRGQGMAGQLMERLADELRSTGRKAVPTCSFAVKWFEEHPDYSDLLNK